MKLHYIFETAVFIQLLKVSSRMGCNMDERIKEWITNELSIRMIKAVDKSDVISSHLIQSPVLGPISIKELSGSVKTLMLMAFDQSGKVFNASVCGDDCAKWILSIAKKKDLTINLRYIMDFGDEDFEIEILNTGDIVHNMLEYIDIAGEYV